MTQTGLLTEADTSVSTGAEDVFVHLWNFFTGPVGKKIKSKEDFLNTPWNSDKNLKVLMKFWKANAGKKVGSSKTIISMPKDEAEASDVFFNLYQQMKKVKGWGSSPNAQHSGAQNKKLSAYWDSMKPKDKDTSKADIIINGQGVSIKNGGGARLMSGVPAEAKATIETAIKQSGAEGPVLKELNALIDKFTEPLITMQKDIPMLADPTRLHLRDFAKVIKDPEQVKKLNAANKKAMEEYKKGDALRADEKTKEIIKKHFSSGNSKFAKAWAWEAGSGAEKFSARVNMPIDGVANVDKAGDTSGEALWMFAFKPDMTELKINPMTSPDDDICKKIASQTSIRFDFKSNMGSRGRRGYQTMQAETGDAFAEVEKTVDKEGESIANTNESYQTMRNDLFSELDGIQSLNESIFTEADKWHRMLNEGLITEGQWWDKIKGFASKMVDGLKKAWTTIKNKLMEIRDAFAEAIKGGYKKVMEFMGIEMTNIKVKTEFNLL